MKRSKSFTRKLQAGVAIAAFTIAGASAPKVFAAPDFYPAASAISC
jgi:hypothetical protein